MGSELKRKKGNGVLITIISLIAWGFLFTSYFSPGWPGTIAFWVSIAAFFLFLYLGYGRDMERFKTMATFLVLSFTFGCGFTYTLTEYSFLYSYSISTITAKAISLSFILLTITAHIAIHAAMYFAKEDGNARRTFVYLATQIGILLLTFLILNRFLGGVHFFNAQAVVLSLGFSIMTLIQVLLRKTRLGRNFSETKVVRQGLFTVSRDLNPGLHGASIVVNVLLMGFGLLLVHLAYGSSLTILILASLTLFWVKNEWLMDRFPRISYFYIWLKYAILFLVIFTSHDYSMRALSILLLILAEMLILLYLKDRGYLSDLGSSTRLQKLFSVNKNQVASPVGTAADRSVIKPGLGIGSKGDYPNYQLYSQQRNITPKMPSPPTSFGPKKYPKSVKSNKGVISKN